MYDFTYHRPSTLAEAAGILAGNPESKILAGGQTLIPTLTQRLARPSDLVDLSRVGELDGMAKRGDAIVIGAMTRHAEVNASAEVNRSIPGLAHLAGRIGDAQVRNLGTLGGSIANADPAADYPAAVLALNATIRTNKREIAADAFFLGLFTTALEPDEIIVSVAFPVPEKSAYAKMPQQASRFALAGVFVARSNESVRVAVTGAGPAAFRAGDIEKALGRSFAPAAIDGVAVPAAGLNDDLHASRDYRAHLIRVLAKRAVTAMM
jgi:carbon-monoxide dehydrogenase medium subunit